MKPLLIAVVLAAVMALIVSAVYFAPRCKPGDETFQVGSVKMHGC